MTSKRSSVKKRLSCLLKQEFLRKFWMEGVAIIALMFALPVQMALKLGRYQGAMAEMPDGILFGFMLQNKMLLGVIFLLSISMALVEFGYLFQRNKVDFYHSLPISRTMHFTYRYLNGILQFVLPYVILYAAAIMVGIVNGALIIGYVKELIITGLLYFIFFCILYSVSVIAVQLAGSYMSGLVTMGILHFGSVFFCYVINEYCSFFLRTYVDTGKPLLYGYGSALTICMKVMEDYGKMSCWSAGLLIMLTAMLVFLPLIACGLFLKRPAEKTSCGLAYPLIGPILRLIAVVGAGLFGGLVLRSFSYDQSDSWLFFGLAAGCILMHCIMQMILEMNFRAFFKGKISLLVCTAVTALIMCCYRYDLRGYDEYLPEAGQLDSVGVSIQDLEYYRNYPLEYTSRELQNLYSSDYGYDVVFSQIYDETERYTLLQDMGLKNTESVLDMVQRSIEDNQWVDYEANMIVCFRLKNGRSIFRQYEIDLMEEMDACKEIFAMDDFKEVLYPILARSEEHTTIWMNDNYSGTKQKLTLPDTQFTSLLRTYKRELKDLQLQTMTEEIPLLTLEFTDNQDGIYNSYPVYPSFEHTLTLLKGYGYEFSSAADQIYEAQVVYRKAEDTDGIEAAASIEAATLQEYDSETVDEQKSITITDEKQLKQLRKYLVPYIYYASALTLKEIDQSYHVTGYLKDTVTGEVIMQDFGIEKGKVPEFLRVLEE